MADTRRVGAAEQGISGMMVDLHRSFGAPLSDAMLFAWHRVLTTGRRDLERTGSYRTHPEPMQIVSDVLNEPVVHFEAPPPAAMPVEMARFINSFNRTASDGPTPLPALIRAGIAHIGFVSVHPFEDGNSRIGRAIAEEALAQNLGHPTLMALAATIMARRKAYFEALERSNTTNELTGWLMWFVETAIEAERRTIVLVGFLIGKTRLMDRLKGALNPRQEKALLRVLREGPDGFEGGLSAGNYAAITGALAATATRDLANLVAKGGLARTGELRHARYWVDVASG